MAAATLPFVQRTRLDAPLGGSQANRAALAPAKRTPGRSELQPTDTQLLGAETVPSGSITPGSFTGHQATGTFNSQPILLRSFPKLLGTVQKLLGTVQKLFSSGTECSLVVLGWRFLLGIIRFVGRRRQGSALTGS